MAKRLLVGSVYASSEQRQREWFELQSEYLSKTTSDYDHVVVVNHPDTSAFDDHVKVVYKLDSDPTRIHGSQLHLDALNELHKYFLSVQDDYDCFLFLDNDAFPIRKNWEPLLANKMSSGQLTGRADRVKEIAVILRPEICEFRWHASVLYATKEGLRNLEFIFSPMHYLAGMGKDLLGNIEDDIHINYQATQVRDSVLPLVRTNQYNLHPVAFGIYYDMFYHHTFGSEHGVKTNSTPFDSLRNVGKYGYGDFYANKDYPYREIYAELMTDPVSFIAKLGGWSVDEYAEVAGVANVAR